MFSQEKVKQTDSMRKKGQSQQAGNEKEQTFGWEEICWIYYKEKKNCLAVDEAIYFT